MKTKHILLVLACILLPTLVKAQQQPMTPEQEEKKMRDNIETMVLKYEESLNLEVWQTFYVDSILTHNYTSMMEESRKLAVNRVENYDLYQLISDKWEENTYNAFHKILDEDQWKRYLKQGAGRAKKSRDQRAAKREGKK
ncbi:MAG: hypothetical protein J6X57_02660 [Bacteroidales bacterium]|nr:hypothetical protein [Bacteroidales bacterium]